MVLCLPVLIRDDIDRAGCRVGLLTEKPRDIS